jgi:aminoglycoside phosphotransferase (APT) family kinase protein
MSGRTWTVSLSKTGSFRSDFLACGAKWSFRDVYAAMSEVMARLHMVDWRAVGLENFGKPVGYLSRQVLLWTRQYEAAKTHAIPAMDELIGWLPAHMPADDTTTIAHGDFRRENLMYHPTQPRVIGVLDWELATLGHPFADVAYNCMIWQTSDDDCAAVNDEDLTGDVCRRVRCHQQSGALEIVRTAELTAWRVRDEIRFERAKHDLRHLRWEISGRKRIDGNAVVSPFGRKRPRHIHDTAFGGIVADRPRHLRRVPLEALDRSEIDNAALARGDHRVFGSRLRQ